MTNPIMCCPYRPSIVGKKRGNQTYYYLVELARVDGKPRIVDQRDLGCPGGDGPPVRGPLWEPGTYPVQEVR